MKKAIKTILPLTLVFIASLYRPIDPDLGWHLKYGEYFFENLRPLRENIYSTQMQDFHWSNVSWGVDVLNYALYSSGGFLALTIAGALVVVLAFFFFSRAFNLDYWQKAFVFPVLLYFLSPINSTSFRGQTLSLAFLGALIFILKKYEEDRGKIIFLLPILFLLWANLHGLFIMGLGIFVLWQGLFCLSLYLQKRQIDEVLSHLKKFVEVTALSVATTLIHPFGAVGIYKHSFLHFRNPLLKNIMEYLPPGELTLQWYNFYFAIFFVATGFAAYALKKRLTKELPQLGLFVIFFGLSLWVKRYSWAMYYMMTPLIAPAASLFKPVKKKSIFWGATFLFSFFIFFVIFLKTPFSQYVNYDWDVYCDEFNNCSPEAAEALREYYVEGKTMTLYNWGGWLIWNYPDLKPSTDGRMTVWRDETGFSAFEHDYNIEQNLTDVNNSKYDVVFTGNFKPIYDRLKELDEEGKWELVYEDETSAIFVRN